MLHGGLPFVFLLLESAGRTGGFRKSDSEGENKYSGSEKESGEKPPEGWGRQGTERPPCRWPGRGDAKRGEPVFPANTRAVYAAL